MLGSGRRLEGPGYLGLVNKICHKQEEVERRAAEGWYWVVLGRTGQHRAAHSSTEEYSSTEQSTGHVPYCPGGHLLSDISQRGRQGVLAGTDDVFAAGGLGVWEISYIHLLWESAERPGPTNGV